MSFIDTIVHNVKLSGFRSTRSEFYLELAKSIEAKETTRDFLAEEIRIATNKKTANPSRAYALRVMARKQAQADQNGYSALLGAVMPPSDRLMLAALDDAAEKPELLRTLSQAILAQKEIIAVIKGKIIPPLMMLPGVFAFCYILATKSIPIIVDIAPPEVWNAFNSAVRWTAELLANNSGKMVVVALTAGTFFVYQLPRWIGPWRLKFESMSPSLATLLFPICPFLLPLSIYRDLQVGLMFSSLAVMLSAGRTLTDALNTVRNASQPWMKWHLRKVLNHLEMYPTEYTKAFSKGLLSPQLLARLSSQIRTNPNFAQVLIKVGTQGGEDIRKEVQKQAGMINIMLMFGGAGLFMFMMLGQMAISQSMSEEMTPAAMMKRKLKKAAAASHAEAVQVPRGPYALVELPRPAPLPSMEAAERTVAGHDVKIA